MGGIAGRLLKLIKKMLNYILEYTTIVFYWKLRFYKVQLQKWKKCNALKKLGKAHTGLGSEIYVLHKQGESQWAGMPSVQQQLSTVEEAEARVLHVDSMIDEINSNYLQKKQEIKERYAERRAEIDSSTDQGSVEY